LRASQGGVFMSLKQALDDIRTASAARVPPDKLAVMHRATADLRASGILERVLKVGDTLPPFALANADGVTVQSSQLLGMGAVVLTVFRGHW